jgi:hypothetical protein
VLRRSKPTGTTCLTTTDFTTGIKVDVNKTPFEGETKEEKEKENRVEEEKKEPKRVEAKRPEHVPEANKEAREGGSRRRLRRRTS